jgi:hypothetical protein
MGNCPKCDKDISIVNTYKIEAYPLPSPGHTWKAVKHCCPFCGCVLGVQIDPVALKADILEVILAALDKR